MLLFLILIPLIAATIIPVASKRHVRAIAMLGTLAPLAMVVAMFFQHNWLVASPDAGNVLSDVPQYTSSFAWFPDLGLTFKLGVNGVSMALIALTALLGPICVAASATAITTRLRTYFGWLLILQSAMTGVFLARDVILFYTFFEFTLVPMFVLISLFGSTNRKAAAIKFFLYTFTGSVIALAGILYVAWFATDPLHSGKPHPWNFDIVALRQAAGLMSAKEQMWVFAALMLGFAVKVPLFPLHTWLPLAHTEAPTAGSVILAGVLLKLGTYGIYMFAIPFCPVAAVQAAPFIALLSILGILVAGLICWVQTDVKKLVAYSSVAHLGFCMLGMFAFNVAGLQGSVLYMINHGLSTGALFLCIGMIYERYHTRSMSEINGLAARMPVWATFMVFFTMASVGLPGLNGFVSEFLCLFGAFQADSSAWKGMVGGTGGNLGPYVAGVAAVGMIVAAIYLLYMVGKVVFGPLKEPHGHGHDHPAPAANGDEAPALPTDLSVREIAVLAPLAVLCLVLGVYPKPLMTMIDPSVQKTAQLVQGVQKDLLEKPAAPHTADASPKASGEASR